MNAEENLFFLKNKNKKNKKREKEKGKKLEK